MSTKNLDSKLNKIWSFIYEYQMEHGYSPTYNEIGVAAKLKSKRGVSLQLEKLEDLGLIARDKNARRAIKVLKTPDFSNSSAASVPLPVLGEVVAGEPKYAEETPEGYVSVSLAETRGTSEAFLLRIVGDSMSKKNFKTGDFAIVVPQSIASNGDIVIAYNPDTESATMKRFQRVDDYIILIPESFNPKYSPIVGKDFIIQGKVVGRIPADEAVFLED